jgi:hypothetical protein
LIDDPLRIFAGAIGLVLGVLYALSGFADAGKTDDLSKNQRVKNLLWLLGGAGAVLLGDWSLLSPAEITPQERAALVSTYAFCAVSAAVGGIVLIAVVIALTIRDRGTRKPQFKGRVGELVLDYITYGYRYFRTQLENLDKEVSVSADAAQSMSELGKAVATVMTTTALDRMLSDQRQRETFIDQVLDAMEQTVKLFASGVHNLELQTNYMVRVTAGDLGQVQPLFVDEPLDNYDGFLILRRYRTGMKNLTCLPLETAARAKHVLPGAPTSVAKQSSCQINPRKLSFESAVPVPLQKQVKDFFRDANYASVLSVPSNE